MRNQCFLFGRKRATSEDFFLEGVYFYLVGELTSQKEPKNTFWNRFTKRDRGWAFLLDLSKTVTTICNTFICVQLGGLVVHAG
jgi:hypothetical protein